MNVEIPDSDALCRKRRSRYRTLGRIAAMLAMLPLIAPVVGMTLLWLAHRFDWPAWILGVIGLLAIAGAWYVGWRTLCVHGFRFSLRTGLIAFALAGVLPGLAGRWFLRTWRHAEAVAEVTGGSPYGASTIADGNGSRQPSANELEGARYQGRHVATIAAKLAA